jgi:hypothetical protein
MKTVFALVCAVLLLPCARADAVLVSLDDTVFGPDTITLDTASGLEWLDLDLTIGISYNAITAQFSLGGDFAGFRHATFDEVTEFWTHANIPIIATDGYKLENYSAVRSLQDLVTCDPFSEGCETNGLVAATPNPPSGMISWVRFLIRIDDDMTAIANTFGTAVFDLDSASSLRGHWIVRPTTVPEPSTLLLFAAALACMVRRVQQ